MKEQVSGREIVADIKANIQFLVTAEILMAAVMYGFFKAQGASEVISNDQTLAWYIGVAFSIFNYATIGIKEIFPGIFLKLVRFSVSLTLVLLGIVILLMAVIQYRPLPGCFGPFFFAALNGSLWMPIATFIQAR